VSQCLREAARLSTIEGIEPGPRPSKQHVEGKTGFVNHFVTIKKFFGIYPATGVNPTHFIPISPYFDHRGFR
jgi:hypothetical protein